MKFNLGLSAVLFGVFEPPYKVFRQALHVTDNFLDVLIFIFCDKLFLFLLSKAVRWVPKRRRIETFVVITTNITGVVGERIH